MSGGDCEFGRCDVCGAMAPLSRKYYRYDVKCECCGGGHFEIVRHCGSCEPKPPVRISAVVKHIKEAVDG